MYRVRNKRYRSRRRNLALAAGAPDPPANIFFDIQQASVGTNTGGTDDFIATGFGTPKAAFNAIFNTVTTNNVAADAGFSMGVSNAAIHANRACTSQDAAATMETWRHNRTSAGFCVETLIPSTNQTRGKATLSTITNGVRYTWTQSLHPTDLILNNLMFGGSALSAAVGQSEAVINNNATDAISGLGFVPDAIIMLSGSTGPGSNAQATASMSLGFGDASLNQGSIYLTDQDATVTSRVDSKISDSFIANSYMALDGQVEDLELTSIDADGFTVTARTPSGSWAGARTWLAVKLADSADVKVGAFTLPTSTGVFPVAGVGFKPRLVIQAMTSLTVFDTQTRQDGLFGLSLIMEGSQFSGGVASADLAAAAKAKCASGNKAVYHPGNDGVTQWEGAFSSFDLDGYSLNYTKVPGTANKGIYIAFR